MNELSGWGTARKMVEIYGDKAHGEARRRSAKALAQDDMLAFERWAHIATVIGTQIARSGVQAPQTFH